MGGSLCNCNKDYQNVPTSYTNYKLIDDNFKTKKRQTYKYYANLIVSTKYTNNTPDKEQNPKVEINPENKDVFISKNNSSSYLIKTEINNIFEPKKNPEKNSQLVIIEKIKSNFINNFKIKIQEFADFISEEQFNEIDNNPIIKKLQENLTKNFFETKNDTNNKLNKEYFELEPLQFKKDKSIYKGSWNLQGKKEGFGILIDSQGNKYIGEWKNDQFHGKGQLLSINGDFYEGDFIFGEIEGNGIFYSSKNGYNYNGEFNHNKFHGKGVLIYDDETSYEGNFSEGYMNGEGNILFQDGSYYIGNFEKNNYNGKGKFFFKDGRRYNGDWKDNALDGLGVFTWNDRTKYNGEYKNNMRDGNGVYSFGANLYDGYWVNNTPHGNGTLLYEGLRIEGIFRYGKIVEIIERKAANRDIFEKFTLIKSSEISEQKNHSKNSLPKLYSTFVIQKKLDIPMQLKSNKNNIRLKLARKSKEKDDIRRNSKRKSKSKSKTKIINIEVINE